MGDTSQGPVLRKWDRGGSVAAAYTRAGALEESKGEITTVGIWSPAVWDTTWLPAPLRSVTHSGPTCCISASQNGPRNQADPAKEILVILSKRSTQKESTLGHIEETALAESSTTSWHVPGLSMGSPLKFSPKPRGPASVTRGRNGAEFPSGAFSKLPPLLLPRRWLPTSLNQLRVLVGAPD